MSTAIDPARLTAPHTPTGIYKPARTVVVTTMITERQVMLARRQGLLIELAAIEDYLGLERSVLPRAERIKQRLERQSGIRVG